MALILDNFSSIPLQGLHRVQLYKPMVASSTSCFAQIRTLLNIKFNPIKSAQYRQYGMKPPRSLLIYGAGSCGKRTLAKGLAKEIVDAGMADVITTLSTQDLIKYSSYVKGFQQRAYEVKQLKRVIFIMENVDELFPSPREEGSSSSGSTTDQSIVNAFVDMLKDGAEDNNNIFVIGITKRVKNLNSIVRTLFDDEIKIEPPQPKKRIDIFRNHFGSEFGVDHQSHNEDIIRQVNDDCSGMVGGDIAVLVRQAKINSYRRTQATNLREIKLIRDDFVNSVIQQRRPGANSLSRLTPSIPKVSWDDVGGLDQVKQSLMEMVVWDYKHGDALKRLGVKTPRGVLLYGPPGTGKTLLSRAVAFEANANFIAANISELVQGEIGESEKQVEELFRVARSTAPSIIFIDEIQSIFGQRDASGQHGKSLISQILIELDRLNDEDQANGKRVMVLAATNLPQAIDDSFLQPGRFDRALYVGPPEKDERLKILKGLARSMKLAPDVDLAEVAAWTINFTGSDLAGLMKKSGLYAIQRDINVEAISRDDIHKVYWETKPTVTMDQLFMFEKWNQAHRNNQPMT
ncbi:hypothetical protein SAMD00019534_054460 [Acytostelium subglobosum LB1]|uniref:hypothetical protein n=1 Tax=Acytostelium subglobosum LB1 TaxID=1410327 RepID=UPI000644C681|nr:hypothetical protein SAMD00019534_054460 [Acytostelium subglobosum LB1]GAM22271.1 hypothetical protein SAMD00019534_054460 [Acytostelium subglobosum LB1]|eukprot:XP_012754391.1 hypothetical protein SAMD00019534_054460 [Acytostelium subglobosum LB1]